MMIQSSTKAYSVNIMESFEAAESLIIDEKSFIVIDQKVYEPVQRQVVCEYAVG